MHIGVDIVQISRIKKDKRLAEFILSSNEYALYLKHPNKIEFLAGRYASKEAFLKLKEKGIGEIPFKEIEVLYKENSMIPFIKYEDKEYDVSIAHDGDYAIAVVYEK